MNIENSKSNWDKLKYRVPLILEGFNPLYHEGKPVILESHVQLQLNKNSYQKNFEIFKDRIFNNIGKNFLPIYRMADGEFYFIKELSNINLIYKILYIFKIRKLKTCWGEKYSIHDLIKVKGVYINQLMKISKTGMFAMHFIEFEKENHPYSDLYKSTLNYYDYNNINLNENNYTSFYYVYALLTGDDSYQLLKSKNILIITSFDDQKKAAIENYLINEKNASRVDFYKISATRSMFEKIDFSELNYSYDLVLIGAGIGSSNILCQCEKLNTVCIDAGIVLERYANPTLARARLFLI